MWLLFVNVIQIYFKYFITFVNFYNGDLMKVEITKNKLLSISLIAVLGASFLTSCNNKKSDSKDQNQQTSAPGGEGVGGPGAGGPGAGGPGAGGPGAGGDDSIAGNLADNDLNTNDDEVIDLSKLPHSSTKVSAELKALKLEEKPGLTLKLKSLCGDDTKNRSVINNGRHKTPIVFELSDNSGAVTLTPEQLETVRKGLVIKDIENHNDIELTSAETDINDFTRCANGVVPTNSELKNAIYISSNALTPNKMRLIASLEIEEGKTTIYSVPKSSKYKDALKIPVVENTQKGKTNLFDTFKHEFKVDNNKTKDKYKYITTKYIGKEKSNENVVFTVNDIVITDNDGYSVKFAAADAKLANTIANLDALNIGKNKLLSAIEFMGMDAKIADIQTLFKTTFAGSDFSFHGVKDLSGANKKVQTEKTLGLLIKIDDKHTSTSHSAIKVTLKGNDNFGNEFISEIKDSKW